MLTINVAVVSEVKDHDPSDVARVSAALQRQAIRDFRPVWDVEATVDSSPSSRTCRSATGRSSIRDDIGTPGAAGIHLDKDGQPFALVAMSDSWSLTARTRCSRCSPTRSATGSSPGQSPKNGQGRVEFLVEVCDPSEADEFGYTVNDILMSDFYTPHFFDPVKADGVRYSFTGAITKPRTILKGGYISWHEPVSNHWWQQTWFGAKAAFRDLGVFDATKTGMALRTWIDGQTDHPGIDEGLPKDNRTLMAAVTAGEQTAVSANAKASAWRSQISAIIQG